MSRDYKFLFFFVATELYLMVNMPYMFSKFWPVFNIYISSAFYLAVLFFYLFSGSGKVGKIPSKLNAPFVITFVTWFLYAIIHNDSSYITRLILLVITYLFLLVLCRRGYFVKFWKYNGYFILLQTVLSLFAFILVGMGILHPIMTIDMSDSQYFRPAFFFGLSFSKTYIGNLIRPSGFLDEPGALAAWSIYTLMFNYAFLKDKIISKYLPYLTSVTLSVAYFIQLALFLVLSYIKKIHKLIIVAIIALIGIYFINLSKGSNFDVYQKTIARFELSDETGIEGNNRDFAMENAKRIFLQSPIVGLGGHALGEMDVVLSDNPYEILAKDGIVGFIISYLPLLIILFNNRRKEVLICVVVIAVGYLQRPLHINFMHNMYIWSFLLFALNDSNLRRFNYKNTYVKI